MHSAEANTIGKTRIRIHYGTGRRSGNIERMPAKITINPNGSIRVEGDFEISDGEGKPFGLSGRTAIGLCRCGHSDNKPFCDGSHRKVSFQSVCLARDLPPPAPKV
jgi:CDGSH-type Zn-finger protein